MYVCVCVFFKAIVKTLEIEEFKVEKYSLKIIIEYPKEFNEFNLKINVIFNLTLIGHNKLVKTINNGYETMAIFHNLYAFQNYSLEIFTKVENSNITYLTKTINFTTLPDIPRCLPDILKYGYIRNKNFTTTVFFKVRKKFIQTLYNIFVVIFYKKPIDEICHNGPDLRYVISFSSEKLSKIIPLPKDIYIIPLDFNMEYEYFVHIFPINKLGFDLSGEKRTIVVSKYNSLFITNYLFFY